MLVVKRGNCSSFQSASGLLSAALSVSHLFSKTSHCTTLLTPESKHTGPHTHEPRLNQHTGSSNWWEFLENTSRRRVNYFHFNVQICGRAVCPDCGFIARVWLKPLPPPEDTGFSACVLYSVVRCAAASPCMQGQEMCECVCNLAGTFLRQHALLTPPTTLPGVQCVNTFAVMRVTVCSDGPSSC